MKKGIIAVILVMASFTVFACTNSNTSQQKKSDSKEPVTQMTKDMYQKNIADRAISSKWKFKGDLPTIIDFYADWCGPCRQIAPILKELATEYTGKIRVYKVNVDKEKELAAALGIESLPTVLFIPMSGEPQVMIGSSDKASFKQKIDSFLLKKK